MGRSRPRLIPRSPLARGAHDPPARPRPHARCWSAALCSASSPQGRFADRRRAADRPRPSSASSRTASTCSTASRATCSCTSTSGCTAKFARRQRPAPEPRGALRLRMVSRRRLARPARADRVRALHARTTGTRSLARLGPDPLRKDADPERAWKRLSRSRTAIGALLMDQSVLAGVGNVYRAEVALPRGAVAVPARTRGAGAHLGRHVGRPAGAAARGRARRAHRHDGARGPRPAQRARRAGRTASTSTGGTGLPCRRCGTEVRTEVMVGAQPVLVPGLPAGVAVPRAAGGQKTSGHHGASPTGPKAVEAAASAPGVRSTDAARAQRRAAEVGGAQVVRRHDQVGRAVGGQAHRAVAAAGEPPAAGVPGTRGSSTSSTTSTSRGVPAGAERGADVDQPHPQAVPDRGHVRCAAPPAGAARAGRRGRGRAHAPPSRGRGRAGGATAAPGRGRPARRPRARGRRRAGRCRPSELSRRTGRSRRPSRRTAAGDAPSPPVLRVVQAEAPPGGVARRPPGRARRDRVVVVAAAARRPARPAAARPARPGAEGGAAGERHGVVARPPGRSRTGRRWRPRWPTALRRRCPAARRSSSWRAISASEQPLAAVGRQHADPGHAGDRQHGARDRHRKSNEPAVATGRSPS